jgi:electron transport complex protein RnfG
MFDQFAGATITPRAVVGQVKRVLEFVAANKQVLFNENVKDSTRPGAIQDKAGLIQESTNE